MRTRPKSLPCLHFTLILAWNLGLEAETAEKPVGGRRDVVGRSRLEHLLGRVNRGTLPRCKVSIDGAEGDTNGGILRLLGGMIG